MRSAKMQKLRSVSRFLHAGVLVSIVLLLAACGVESRNTPPASWPVVPASRDNKRPPIDPKVVREDVERHQRFGEVRKAACPRRILDRIEEYPPFPAINILEGLKYVTISDDTSRGKYEKVIELTDLGRRELASDLEEQANRYIITVARREYVPGLERYENAPRRDDRLVVSFQWKWKPLNALGERLTLWAPYSNRDEHGGRATYQRTADGWKLDDLWLDRNAVDYVWGVYK